jgi:ABC-type transporter Mla MlaB component
MNIQIDQQENQLSVSGDIGFSNVESCLKDLCKIIQECRSTQVRVNFEQAKHQDGSIIALMTSLLRRAKALGIKVTYISVPAHILRISELYGVRNILPIVV